MRTWRSDPRFFCPECRRIICIGIGMDYDPDTNWYKVSAVCPDCSRAYTKEEWRRLHGGFRPRSDVSPGPGSVSGES